MFQTHTKKWLARKSQSFIAFSRVSGRYVKHFSDAKVQIFWLALSARSILFFSSFLFLMNKTISRVLRTQSWTYCTDKQWLISNVYIEIWEESYVFNADIKKSARSLRSLFFFFFFFFFCAILYTFSPVSNASSFNKAIYHEHIKWTNTRTYCTDKNMLLTNLTIARFQRKIRKFRLARLQSVTYAGTYSYCKKKKKKKPYYQLLRKIWWLPHPRPPTRALYAKLQLEKLQFLSLLTTILNAFICWKFESFRGLCPLGPRQGLCPCTPPGALKAAPGPHPYEKNRMFQTHTHNWIARNHL